MRAAAGVVVGALLLGACTGPSAVNGPPTTSTSARPSGPPSGTAADLTAPLGANPRIERVEVIVADAITTHVPPAGGAPSGTPSDPRMAARASRERGSGRSTPLAIVVNLASGIPVRCAVERAPARELAITAALRAMTMRLSHQCHVGLSR